ncbi:DUF721 domain-containing protein [Antarcticibacterium flavum]|uniref:DUF721 domain-containing protein n=1 Tax=Antarcticibacterium flavum TaxID=2058175 RepID=A0A5B7X894_9FLAO|nr:DUF721 domain-containing protein [Antarcticibacterium flavum]MCM4159325.1 DUF721 domain-containing protein [Antarcticibacterium sp. W02-3]QCY70968.1 DUF721 domain-containing protein [Antarcticibacterium flavum]
MMKRNNENITIGDALKDFVSKNKLQTGLDKINVRDVWNQQMGPAIEKYTTAIKLEGSTLFVQLSSSVLREELGYGKEKIIRNLNEALGKDLISKLVLR